MKNGEWRLVDSVKIFKELANSGKHDYSTDIGDGWYMEYTIHKVAYDDPKLEVYKVRVDFGDFVYTLNLDELIQTFSKEIKERRFYVRVM